jgi:hypothetical protein
LVLFFSLLPISALAQGNLNILVSNLLRYGVGNEVVSTVSTRRDYVENLTEAKISFHEFLIGFRLLFDAPPEYGVEFSGMKKRYIEFRKDNLYIRAGDSFSLYGRGLALNLFENRGLAHDTGIDGIKMEYNTDFVKLNLIGGNMQYLDVINLSRRESYKLRAGSVEITPMREFSLGINFVSGKYEPPPNTFPDQRAQFDIPEYFASVRIADFDLYASYAEKRTTLTALGDTTGRTRVRRSTVRCRTQPSRLASRLSTKIIVSALQNHIVNEQTRIVGRGHWHSRMPRLFTKNIHLHYSHAIPTWLISMTKSDTNSIFFIPRYPNLTEVLTLPLQAGTMLFNRPVTA